MESIYDLGLHDRISLGAGLTVTRVSGGWIYNNVFVPYNEEFKGSITPDLSNLKAPAESVYQLIRSNKKEPEFVNVTAPGDKPDRMIYKIKNNGNEGFVITGNKRGKLK